MTPRPLALDVVGALMAVALPQTNGVAGAAPQATVTQAAGTRGSATSYSLHRAGGHVIRWNPCRAVHYRVNAAHAPRGALRDVKSGVWRASKVTGLTFIYDGSTTRIPQRSYATNLDPTRATPTMV